MTPLKKNILTITLLTIGLTIVYLALLVFLKNISNWMTLTEFADYVGGILNPFFTLLSTSAIIYISYLIAKNETTKANETIATQKQITLNQMRQEALNNITNKLDLFVYQLNKISIYDVKPDSLVQRVLTNNLTKDEKEPILVWVTILYELESFLKYKHLFGKLFENKVFTETYNSIIEITTQLGVEQSNLEMITKSTLEKYIEEKQRLVTIIGNFILSEF